MRGSSGHISARVTVRVMSADRVREGCLPRTWGLDMYGTIDRVVHKHGFGFIRAYDGAEVFFHRRSLIELDFHSLKEGQMVEFEEHQTPGEDVPRAVVVRPRRRLLGSR